MFCWRVGEGCLFKAGGHVLSSDDIDLSRLVSPSPEAARAFPVNAAV